MSCLAVVVWVCVPFPVVAQTGSVTGRLVLEAEATGQETKADYSDAVVWLTSIGASEPGVGPTPDHLELVQKDKRFSPRILAMPVGSTVDFPNRDPFFHNVFSLFEGKRFDLGLYEAGTTRSALFDRPGVSYIFCNIHPDMVAVVVAVETDLFGLTDARGRFQIEGVPVGKYQLHVWHERMEASGEDETQTVSVGPAGVEVPSILMTGNGLTLEGHTNKYGLEYESPSSGGPYLLPQ